MNKNYFALLVIFVAAMLLYYGFSDQFAAADDWQKEINWSNPTISYDEVSAADKPVYLFVTTEWCTFCKKMKNETFADKRVQQILNEKFTSVTINPEVSENVDIFGGTVTTRELAEKLGVDGYPANYFFAPDGTPLGNQPGYLSATQFLQVADYIGSGYYKTMEFGSYLKNVESR